MAMKTIVVVADAIELIVGGAVRVAAVMTAQSLLLCVRPGWLLVF